MNEAHRTMVFFIAGIVLAQVLLGVFASSRTEPVFHVPAGTVLNDSKPFPCKEPKP